MRKNSVLIDLIIILVAGLIFPKAFAPADGRVVLKPHEFTQDHLINCYLTMCQGRLRQEKHSLKACS